MSLRARILLLVLLATLTPAAVFGLYFFNERERNIDEAKQALGALANYAAENLDDKIKGTVQLLHGLSRASDIDTADKAACSEFLASVLARYPQYTGLLTITPQGDLHCDSLRTGRKLNLTEREYFKQVVATAQPAFDAVFGGLTGIAVLQVAYPVLDSRGKLKYVLLASFNLSGYAQSFAAASSNPNIRVMIWDRKGVLMVHKPDGARADLVGKDFSTSELFRFVASDYADMAATLPSVEGVSMVWARGIIPEPHNGGARIVLGIPQGVLVEKANRDLRNALILLIGVTLLAFIIAWYVAETGIRRHVLSIASVAQHIESGDFAARSGPPYPRGELGELMAVVDRTASAVQGQQTELASKGKDLQKLNRTLRVLSGISTLIVRVRDRDELFKEACRIVVEAGGFRMALVGILDRSTMRVVPVASLGKDEELLSAINAILSSSVEASNTMIVRALLEKNAVVSNNSDNDPRVLFDRKYAEAGVRSLAVFPLIVSGEAEGVLALYSSEPDFFQTEEMILLTELASNIAFAIDYIGKRERIEYLAYYDVLTGLANRSLFLERVAQYLRSATSGGHKLVLYLIDLERFKNINDSLGRSVGDALLIQVAEWLTRNAGDASLLSRLDADHFAAVMPEVKQNGDVARLLDKTMKAFQEHPFCLNDAVLRIAVKVGVACFPADGADADTLFKNAEAALKKAKASGERYLFHTQTMTEAVAAKLTLENQLRLAIDNEEFVLHFQPKVDLTSGKLTGAEALIRWNDPRTGLAPPDRFIPLLEETGLIYEVGRWALRQAIEDYLRWREAGLAAVPIAVNVSPLQLRNINFIDEIEHAVAFDAHAAQGLELEITESVIMDDVEHSIATLQAIRAMGIAIAIDDFGTGFSSLSYLAKLPVDIIKIDRSFVIDMTSGAEGLALVSTIIGLAHALKLKAVAEGVETEEQARLLRLLNCDEMQGYLFSKPVPRDIFETRFLSFP